MSEKDVNAKPEKTVPAIVTPPEISELYRRIDKADEQVEFVLGEISQSEGLKIGGHLGFIYGVMVGVIICMLLKFVFQLI